MAHPTQFERVTFAFGGQAYLPRVTGNNDQAAASNSNLRWLHVPDLNLFARNGAFRQTIEEGIRSSAGVGKGSNAPRYQPFPHPRFRRILPRAELASSILGGLYPMPR